MNSDDSDRTDDAVAACIIDMFESQAIPPRPANDATLDWLVRNHEVNSSVPSPMRIVSRPRGNRMQFLVRLTAAAALITLTVPFWFGGNLALAQVQQQLSEVQTVKFSVTMERTGQPVLSGKAVVRRPQWLRIDWRINGQKNSNVTDYKRGELISYADDSPVTIHELEPSQSFDPVAQLLRLKETDARPLAPSENQRPATELFEIKQGAVTGRLWVAEKSRLPVRLESQIPDELGGGQIVYSDFEWDVAVDENVFQIPEGREVVRNSLLAAPREDEFIAALRLRQAFTEDAYQPGFWNDSPGLTVGRLAYDRDLSRADNYQRQMKALEPILPAIGLGKEHAANPKTLQQRIDFLCMKLDQWQHLVKARGQWVGDGVRHGESKPLCWWRQRNKSIRILFADLTIQDADQPPQQK